MISRPKYKSLINLLLVAVCIMAFIPFLSAARFAVFSGDDFSFYNSVQEQSGSNYFIRCLQDAKVYYMTWQGTYLANLANVIFNPLQWYSYGILRVILIGCLLLTFFSLLLLSVELDAYLGFGKKSIFIFALLLLPFLSWREYTQVYLWYVGAMAYQLPIIFLMLGFALLCRNQRTGKRLWAVLSGICFFLVGGGPLNIGGITAWFLLLVLIVDLLRQKKVNRVFLSLFVVIFVGDLINVSSPGNFARNDRMGGMNIQNAVFSSITVAIEEYSYLLTDTGFVLFLIFAFILGCSWKKNIQTNVLCLTVIGLCITPFIALFPHMLGYNVSSASLAMFEDWDRTMLVLDIAVITALEFSAVLIGSYTAERLTLNNRARMYVKAGVALAAVVIVLFTTKDSVPVKITQNIINGSVEEHGAGWHEIYDMLRDSPGEDVVIIEVPEACVGALDVSYAAYPSHAANSSWAEYFGNKSVCTGYYVYTQMHSE